MTMIDPAILHDRDLEELREIERRLPEWTAGKFDDGTGAEIARLTLRRDQLKGRLGL